MENKFLLLAFVSVIVVAGVNFVANFFYLYWTVWWFDNVTHFLGGLSMGLLWFWIFNKFFSFTEAPKLKSIIFIVLILVLAVGIGWEIFEYIFDIANLGGGETYWQDTSRDLAADTLGAIAASLIIFKKKLHD
ncbi:MAG: hypothetical protein HYT69_02270 [Candidatus Zambryskibacteria bacterium]|nr:hypothetical protein [Candidatus Zambryskibacteria bacterium]